MYSLVLMAALTTSAETPNCCFAWGCGRACYAGWGYGGCYGWGYGGCYGGGYWSQPAYYGGCYGCYGGYSNYAPMGGYPAPAYQRMTPTPAPETLPTPKKTAANAYNQGRLIVKLPNAAKLYIDGKPLQTTTSQRTFRTPMLERGQVYYYLVRAELEKDGEVLSRTEKVIVRAGQVSRADFSDLADTAKTTVARE